jgi:aldehyde dehydrogenase
LKNKTKGGRMSAQTKSPKMSSSIDTSHLKVKFPFKSKYGNFIGGKFVEPKSGKYFDNTTPITNEVICQVKRCRVCIRRSSRSFSCMGKNFYQRKI